MQGTFAAPQPGIISSLVDGFAQFTSALTEAFSNLIKPNDAIKSSINGMTDAFRAVLTAPFVVSERILSETTNLMNSITSNANQLASSQFAQNIVSTVVNALRNSSTIAQRRIEKVITRFGNIASTAFNLLTAPWSLITGPLDNCSVKLTTMLLSSASNTVKAYQKNVTDSVKALNQTLESQIVKLANDLTTIISEQNLGLGLAMDDLMAAMGEVISSSNDEQAAYDCLKDAREMTELLPGMIEDVTAYYYNDALTKADEYSDNLAPQIETLSAGVATAPNAVCACVANVNVLNLLERGRASTCANNAAKVINSDSVTTQAATIGKDHEAAMVQIATEATEGINQSMAGLPDLVEHIKVNVINACKGIY